MTSAPFPPSPRRTWFTNLVGVAVILLGGIGTLFSAFALLLAIGKPYASSSSDPLDIFLIFILPPGTLLAGFGLLFRQRWARWWMILLMAAFIALGVKGLLAPSYEKATVARYYSDSHKQSILIQSVVCTAIGGLILLGLFSGPVRREFASNKFMTINSNESWRVGHHGRDLMYYEELHGNNWQRLEIDGEMLTGRAHHVIYFADAETWQRYPEWARQRREEIIARIKSRFSEPDYEYQENGTASTALPTSAIPTTPPKPDGTILPALLFLLFIAAARLWFAASGIHHGETRLPARSAGNHRIMRSEKPTLFWTSIGLLGTIGTASTGAAAWLLLHRIRNRR